MVRDIATSPSEWPAEQVKRRLRADLLAAMRAGDRVAVPVLRSAIAALDNAEAVPDAGHEPTVGLDGEAERRRLTNAEVAAVLLAELRSRTAAADTYRQRGQTEAAAALAAETRVLARYVPEPPPPPAAER